MRRFLVAAFVLGALIVGTVALGSIGIGPVVITREGEQKLVLFASTPLATLTEPGFSFRPPVPVLTQVLTFDARLLYLNTPSSKIQTRDQERIVIDNYVVWRIADPLLFYKSFKGVVADAESRISDVVSADVREVVGKHTLAEVLSDSRLDIMKEITTKSALFLSERGISIDDVRINRTDLPEASIQNVYARMRTERERLARKYRAEGDEEGRRVRAEADRQSKVIVAEAQRDADITRGEGDGKAARIFAQAYSRDPEFYAFWRSLQAYRASLGEGTTLILSPEGGFFEFLEFPFPGREARRSAPD
ncbi:MAG: protease modulator HflC [Myxococcota bacterium]|nr:protease modulator HflC [Myxococcota bacterium]